MSYLFYKPEEASKESIKYFKQAFANKNIGAFIWLRALDNGKLQVTTNREISTEYDCYNKNLATKAIKMMYKKIKANPQWGMNVVSHANLDSGYMKIRFLKKVKTSQK